MLGTAGSDLCVRHVAFGAFAAVRFAVWPLQELELGSIVGHFDELDRSLELKLVNIAKGGRMAVRHERCGRVV